MNQNEGTKHQRTKYFLKFKPFLIILFIFGIIYSLLFDLVNCLFFVFLSTFVYCLTGLIITGSNTFIIMCCIQFSIIAPMGINFALLNVNFEIIGIIILTISETLTICYGLKKRI